MAGGGGGGAGATGSSGGRVVLPPRPGVADSSEDESGLATSWNDKGDPPSSAGSPFFLFARDFASSPWTSPDG